MSIVCKTHGVFYQDYAGHFSERLGCRKCKKSTNSTIDLVWKRNMTGAEFIRISKVVHGDLYDYSQIDESESIVSGKRKVKIICKQHGSFEQAAYSHVKGAGCAKCGGVAKATTAEFVEMSKKAHGDVYDYSQVVYISNKHHVRIVCKTHGVFEQRPNNHLRGEGCYKCGKEQMASVRQLSYNDFLTKAKKVHGDKYQYLGFDGDYVNVDATYIKAICSKHGEFCQKIHPHLAGSGCPTCNASKGELNIENWLKTHNVVYERQKSFDGCINPTTQRRLKYDYYVPHVNLLIEYDGEHHFRPISFGSRSDTIDSADRAQQQYEDVIHRDKVKNQFAKQNNIPLLRISYEKFDQIDSILNQHILSDKKKKTTSMVRIVKKKKQIHDVSEFFDVSRIVANI
jgi:hypothetical protein